MPPSKLIALLLRLSTALLTCSPHRRRRTMIWVSRCLREAVSHLVAYQAEEKKAQDEFIGVTLKIGEPMKLGDILHQIGIPNFPIAAPTITFAEVKQMYDTLSSHEDHSLKDSVKLIHGHPIGTKRCQPHAQTELNPCAGTCGLVLWTIPLPEGAKAMCPACLDTYHAGNVTPEDNT